MVTEVVQIVVRQKGAKATSAQVRSVGTSARSAAASVRALSGALAAVGIGFGLVSAVRTLAEFETRMAAVQAISGATGEEFARLEAKARQLGATTVFAASEAAQGLRLFAQAGFSVEESLGAIDGTLELAIAGQLGLAQAVNITSNAVRGFNLEATEAGRVSDVLAQVATRANTTVGDLGSALSFVAPVAASAGLSVEETSAALGILADAGIQGTRAGTGLRRILSGLLNPTAEAEGVLESFGLTLQDVNPSVHELRTVVERLGPALENPTVAFQLFGQRGGPAATALAALSDRFEGLSEAAENADGRAKEIADTLLDTLSGSFRILNSAVEETILSLGDSGGSGGLTGSLADTNRFLAAVLNELVGVENELTATNPLIGETADVLREWAEIFSELVGVIGTAIEVISDLRAESESLVGSVGIELPSLAEKLSSVAQAFTIFLSSVRTGLRAIAVLVQGVVLGATQLGNIAGLISDAEVSRATERFDQAILKLSGSAAETRKELEGLLDIFRDTTEGPAVSEPEVTTGGGGTPTPSPAGVPTTPSTPGETQEERDAREQAAERIAALTDRLRIARQDALEPLNAERERLAQVRTELAEQAEIAGDSADLREALLLVQEQELDVERRRTTLQQEQDALLAKAVSLSQELAESSPELANQLERAVKAALDAGGGLQAVNREVERLTNSAEKELRQDNRFEDLGRTIGNTLGGAMKSVLRGEAVDFAETLAEVSSNLLEEALNNVLENVGGGLEDLFESGGAGAGGEGGGGISGALVGALGIGAGLIAGAMRDTTSSIQNDLAQSPAVQDVQATRGVIAGPTNIPIFEVGASIEDALEGTNEILSDILSVLRSGAGAAGGGSVESQAGSQLGATSPTLF